MFINNFSEWKQADRQVKLLSRTRVLQGHMLNCDAASHLNQNQTLWLHHCSSLKHDDAHHPAAGPEQQSWRRPENRFSTSDLQTQNMSLRFLGCKIDPDSFNEYCECLMWQIKF